jgi:hypothetical protein
MLRRALDRRSFVRRTAGGLHQQVDAISTLLAPKAA